MRTYLDFEKPIAELESKVAELKALAAEQPSVSIEEELAKLESKAREALEETYSDLTPWQKTQVARHPERPHFRHYIDALVQDFTPLAGDRSFAEDQAIIGGIGRLAGRSVMVIGHEKGSDTEGRIKHNFGMARPEGYRKAVRLMEMADRFQLPVVSLVDTAGAYPGIGAEERGQAEAIARSTDCCLEPRRADRLGHHRRGRLGRRGRHRHRQPDLHARTCDLHGGLAGGRGLDFVAGFGARAWTPRPI